MTLLQELQDTVAGIAERVGPSVVGLGRGWGRGSGVIVAPGRGVTNADLLRGGGGAGGVPDGETRLGRVAGAAVDLDVAVVAVDTGEAPAVPWEPDRPA